jgi:hypothetical protein
VNVINLTTDSATSSDKDGLFFLLQKEGDVLVSALETL